MKSFFLFASLLFAFASCQKDKSVTPTATSKVVIDLHSPTAGAVYRFGDTLLVSADVTYDSSELHGYEIELSDSATQAVVWSSDVHQHSDHIVVSEKWVDTLTRPTTLLLKLSIEKDHSGGEADTTVKIYSRP